MQVQEEELNQKASAIESISKENGEKEQQIQTLKDQI